MEQQMGLSFNTIVSFVVCVIDDFNGERIKNGNLLVSLAESHKRPLRKKDGVFVFVDLERMTYTLKIDSDRYFSQSMEVDPDKLDRLDPVIFVRMRPLPSYNFSSAATLLRGRLTDKADRILTEALVRAVVRTRECAKGRILQEKALRGSGMLSLARLSGKISEGEILMLEDKDAAKSEMCRISRLHEDANRFGLDGPLQNDYDRGAFLLPVTETMPDKRGEVAVYFFNINVPRIEVELQIIHDGSQDTRQLEVYAGGAYNFGTLKFT